MSRQLTVLLVACALATEVVAQEPELGLRELWRAGDGLSGDSAQFSGPFIAISVAPDGTVAVLDQIALTVTLLSAADGSILRRVARAGQGPGELGGPVALEWDESGRLWIEDQRNRRYNVYESSGAWVGSVPRPSGSANRRVFPIRVLPRGHVLDHDGGARQIRFFRVDSLGVIEQSIAVDHPDLPEILGIIRPGSALQEALALRPRLLWSWSGTGSSIWLARSDSTRLVEVDLTGDTIRVVDARRGRARFTRAQARIVARANREVGHDGGFQPTVLQAIHSLEDGRVLVQRAGESASPGRELELYSALGEFLGLLRTSVPIHHGSIIDSRGDTLFVHGVGDFDVPLIIKGVLIVR